MGSTVHESRMPRSTRFSVWNYSSSACLIWIVSSLTGTIGTWSEMPSYSNYHDADLIIGGMFPLHFKAQREDNYDLLAEPTVPVCSSYNFRGFRWMQAMLFAIEEINNSSKLLPNVTLGWKIFDTCDTMSRAASQAIDIVDKRDQNTSVSVLVGPTGSDKSIGVANILGIFDLPQISYGSTSRKLSDKTLYNSFLRTIPDDDEQATAIVDLLDFYNWTWVGAIAGDDEYGRPGIAKLKEEARMKGICIEFVEYVSKSMTTEQTAELAKRVKNFNATVFVLFASGTGLLELSAQLKENGVRDKIWVASEAWATSRKVLEQGGSTMHGTLGISTRGGEMEGFRDFLKSVSPTSQASSPFIKEFWEKTFHCSCGPDVCRADEHARGKRSSPIEVTTSVPECTGNEVLSDDIDNPYLQWSPSELEKSYTAYLAVYTIANALENITKCKDGSGLLKGGKCPDLATLEPWQLLHYLKNVTFNAPGLDERFGFDANGDPNATYKLVSWVPVPNGTGSSDNVEFAHVGNYSKQSSPRWAFNQTAIFWHENGTRVTEAPLSICSHPCKPGFRRKTLQSICCHMCILCPQGEFSDVFDSGKCFQCNQSEMSNDNRTGCLPKPEEYMRWDDAYGIAFTCCSLIGVASTVFTAIVFLKKRTTPIVKATNVEISFLLFISLTCCFLTPLLYIVKPEDWSCRGRQISFILSFTLCVAAILVKTLRVLTAFQTTMPLNSLKRSKWLGEHLQLLVVFLVALVQVILCVAWLVADPPFKKVDYDDPDRILIICDQGSTALMICVHVYLALLALFAFVFAFRARKLPENFNEAKFITFSMLVFFIVWASFIPAYVSTTGKVATAVYCIGILASTYGFLGCIFFPKVYIILFTPERNTSERVRMMTASHAFRSASRSVVYQINTERNAPPTRTTNANSLGSTLNNNKRGPPSTEVSPCMTRAYKQNRRRGRTSTQTTSSGACRKKGNEVSIEINGKLKSSVKSPIRKLVGETDCVRSSFDVKLQVNISPETDGSEENSPAVSPRSLDHMLDDPEVEDSDDTRNKDYDMKTSSAKKQNGKKLYQSVPVIDAYSEKAWTRTAKKRKGMSKSKSYHGSPGNNSNVIEIIHDVTNEQGHAYEYERYTRVRSSSA